MRISTHLAGLASIALLLFITCTALQPKPAHAQSGLLRNYCAGDVIIVRNKDDLPHTPGAVLLRRIAQQAGTWQRLAVVGETVHWYCHDDSIWRRFDPRSWRIKSLFLDAKCDDSGTDCILSLNVGIGISAVDGWYPESSRCASGRATHVRLGPGDAIDQLCS